MRRVSAGMVLGCLTIGWLAACGSSDEPAGTAGAGGAVQPSGDVLVFGRVSVDSKREDAAAAAGATVTITGDFDGDGKVAANETVTATADGDGNYKATVQLKARTMLSIAARTADHLAGYKRVRATPPSSVRVNAIVNAAEALEFSNGVASLANNKLRIKGLPEGLTGVARIFNPAWEGDSFAGDYVDNSGNTIRSAVFSKVELRDGQGNEVHELGTTATLEMDVPPETWHVVRDMQHGNDRIEVPVYSYNPGTAVWDLDGNGYLVDGAGALIPEAALPSIIDGTYEGRVVSVAAATHFSDKNIDFPTGGKPNAVTGTAKAPQSTRDKMNNSVACKFGLPSCVASTPPPEPPPTNRRRRFGEYKWEPKKANSLGLSPQGDPSDPLVILPGATIQVGFYYADLTDAGHYNGEVEADGTFTFPVGQSEPDGVDLDDNGVAGEKLFARVLIEYGGFVFNLIEGEVPTVADQVASMGDVDVTEGWLVPTYCQITGTMKYKDGAAASDVAMYLESDTYPTEEQAAALCPSGTCTDSAVSGADGTFSIGYPFTSHLRLSGSKQIEGTPTSEWYYAGAVYDNGTCPAAPVNLVLDGEAWTTPTITVVEGVISWDPPRPLWDLIVRDADSNTKWRVTAPDSVITSPVTYGTVPANATEEGPAVGTIGKGDSVQVSGNATTSKGYPEYVSADTVVP